MNFSTEQLLFILWGALSTIQIFIGFLQSMSIQSGDSQIDPEMYERTTDSSAEKVPGVINGVFGVDWMPSHIILWAIFAPLILFLIIIKSIVNLIQNWLCYLDTPSEIRKNKLIKEAEKEKLDLKEFVKKKR